MTTQLYDSSVTVAFNNNARNRYMVTIGEESHSPVGVTTILNKVLAKEALMLWPLNLAINYLKTVNPSGILTDTDWNEMLEVASKLHTVRSDKGKDIGTLVHQAIETYLKEGEVVAEPDAVKPVVAFVDWFEGQKIKVLGVEQITYSKEHDYCGTFDCLLEIDGKAVLCDIKTSNASRTAPLGIYPEHFLQLGAYSKAFSEELPGKKIDDLMIINCSKTGVLSTLKASEVGLSVKECEDAWLNVLRTYRFLEPLKRTIKEIK